MENIEAVCIKADIIGSRKSGKEQQLKKIAQEVNNRFQKSLLTDFTVRFGDELFGVINSFEIGYRVFKELFFLSKKYEVPLYVGVGFGSIVNKNLRNPDDVNGQAIWNSADALEFLQLSSFRGKNTVHSLNKNFKFMFIIGENSPESSIVNYMLYFILEKINKRTEKQTQAVRLLEQHPDLNYEQLGTYLDYGEENIKANVSNLLKRAENNIVKNAEEELIKLIYLINSGEN